jgi:hypothetical protein
MSFLSNILREEGTGARTRTRTPTHSVIGGFASGGYEYKKAIVDSILLLIREIPEATEPGLSHLCECVRCNLIGSPALAHASPALAHASPALAPHASPALTPHASPALAPHASPALAHASPALAPHASPALAHASPALAHASGPGASEIRSGRGNARPTSFDGFGSDSLRIASSRCCRSKSCSCSARRGRRRRTPPSSLGAP